VSTEPVYLTTKSSQASTLSACHGPRLIPTFLCAAEASGVHTITELARLSHDRVVPGIDPVSLSRPPSNLLPCCAQRKQVVCTLPPSLRGCRTTESSQESTLPACHGPRHPLC
jgi:hypothetical protein